jgi:hypothetical protein
MVLGEVKHYIEFVFVNGVFQTHCTCGWSSKAKNRNVILAFSHLHIASSQVGIS